jgi:hypothetical protein
MIWVTSPQHLRDIDPDHGSDQAPPVVVRTVTVGGTPGWQTAQ